MTQYEKSEKIITIKKLLDSFFKAKYESKLRPREERTQEEADLATEILAEALVEMDKKD